MNYTRYVKIYNEEFPVYVINTPSLKSLQEISDKNNNPYLTNKISRKLTTKTNLALNICKIGQPELVKYLYKIYKRDQLKNLIKGTPNLDFNELPLIEKLIDNHIMAVIRHECKKMENKK